MTHTEKTLAALRERFGEAVQAVNVFRGETEVVLDKSAIVEACRLLHDSLNFEQLSTLTASDDWPQEPRFNVLYQLHSLSNAAA